MTTPLKNGFPSSLSLRSALALATVTIALQACGGGSSSSGGGSATADIAGVWDVVEDSALGFDVLDISANGSVIAYFENTFDNCYTQTTATLTNEGNDSYGYVPAGVDEAVIFYTLVNEGDILRYTSSFLNIDEEWPALAVSTADFNICT